MVELNLEEIIKTGPINPTSLLDSLPLGIFQITFKDETPIIFYANNALSKIFNIDLDNLEKKLNPTDYILEKYSLLKYLKKTMSGKENGIIEYNARTGDGKEIIISVEANPLYYEGQIVGVQGYVKDITEEKKYQQKLKEEKKKLEYILDLIPGLFINLDENGNISYANQKAKEVLDYSKEDLIGMNWFDNFLIKSDKKRVKNYFEKIKNGLVKEPTQAQNKILTKKGTKDYLWYNSFNKDPNNTVTAIGMDISDLVKTTNQLLLSEEKYKTLAESSSDPIYEIDLDQNFLYINKAYANRLGLPPEEIIGKNYWDIKSHDENNKTHSEFDQKIKLIKSNKKPLTFEHKSERDSRYFLKTLNPVINPITGKLEKITVYTKDITKLKQTEKELIKTLKLISGFGHNLRTPITGIHGFANLIEELTEEPELFNNQDIKKINQYSKIITESSLHLGGIINDVITFAKNEITSSLKLNPKIHSVDELFNQYLKIGENLIMGEEKPIQISYKTNIDEISVDKNYLDQIMINLVSNATKYTIEGKIIFGLNQKENYLEFYVQDTGLGIPKESIEDIFKAGRIAHPEIRGKQKSTGLGLTITQQLVELMNGNISVESELGKGSKFYFKIPYSKNGKK